MNNVTFILFDKMEYYLILQLSFTEYSTVKFLMEDYII